MRFTPVWGVSGEPDIGELDIGELDKFTVRAKLMAAPAMQGEGLVLLVASNSIN